MHDRQPVARIPTRRHHIGVETALALTCPGADVTLAARSISATTVSLALRSPSKFPASSVNCSAPRLAQASRTRRSRLCQWR